MKSSIRLIILIVSLLIYIYNVQLRYFPIPPKTLLAIPGFVYFMYDISKNRFGLSKIQKYCNLLGIAFALFCWGVVVMLLNNSDEMLYYAYIKYFFLWFFAIYFICHISRGVIHSFLDLCKVIAITVFIESLIAFFMKFNTSFALFINSIQEIEAYRAGVGYDYFLGAEDLMNFMRIIGLGNAVYFGVVTSCTIGLISCAYVLSFERQKIFYIICYIVISVVSLMTARVSMVATLMGIILILYYNFKKNSLNVISVFAIVSIISVLLFSLATEFLPENMLEWQMELFGSGGDKGQSNREVIRISQWLTDTDFDVKTLFYGDGHYKTGEYAYYKNIDVGYFRQIFYSGVLGLFVILVYNWTYLKLIRKCNNGIDGINAYTCVLFLCYLLFMIKGDVNFSEYFLLILMLIDFSIIKRKILV